ncbi:NUDIX hydrolase [Hymenobacter sp. B81]|uniref:NUDIX hydrolase n=1 Tax=Hymenobacter sp. B81 TaxID=3344878 RepID=UPI0037DCC509
MNTLVQVGVGIIIRNAQGHVLLGRRKGSHGAATWSFPGGHVESGEELEQTAKREVKEETTLNCLALHPYYFTNDIFREENKHYVTLFFECTQWEGVVVNAEPTKCLGWEWFDPMALPNPLFLPIQQLIAAKGL